MFETYFVPILIFAVLGLLAGVLLTAASKIFYVKTDERIEQISDALPQANCGACGFAAARTMQMQSLKKAPQQIYANRAAEK